MYIRNVTLFTENIIKSLERRISTICGIVYSKNFHGRDSTVTVLKRFEAQRTRGTTSFGFYLPKTNKLCHNVKEGRIKSLLRRSKGENSEILFHHRFSTSTPDVRNACHPFSTKDTFENEYIGVHNGVISNSKELQGAHKPLGIEYVSVQPDGRFNDSEALIYDIARYLEGDVTKLTAAGTIAFVIIKRNKSGKPVTLFFGRNYGNPLKMKITKNSLTLSSQGEGEDVEANQLYSYDYDTQKILKRPLTIPSSNYGYSGRGYQPYTPPKSGAAHAHSQQAWGYGNRSDGALPSSDSWEDTDIDDDWEEYLNERYGTTTKSDDKGSSVPVTKIPKLNIRNGSYESVKNQFLEENGGDYTIAAIGVLDEVEEGYEFLRRAEEILEGIPISEDKAFQDYIDSYNEHESYVRMLEHIATELEEKSVDGKVYRRSDIDNSIDGDSDNVEVIHRQAQLALGTGK